MKQKGSENIETGATEKYTPISEKGDFLPSGDAMKKTIRIGVIGAGDNLIRKILDSVEKTDGVEITAIADIYPTIDKLLAALAQRKNDDRSAMYRGKLEDNLKKLKQLVNDKEISYFSVENNNFEDDFFEIIDAVHISSPNETHGYYAVLAMEKQKHILCEKPFTETYTEAVNILNQMNRVRKGGEKAMISATHYLRYGPAQEYLKHLNKIQGSSSLISEISAYFVEDTNYLNERSKAQFSRRGAIHDMIIHYVALLHKMGARIYPGERINSKLGDTITYTLPEYKNETAVTSFAGLAGPNFSSDSQVYFKAAKGNNVNSKFFNVMHHDGKIIQLNFLSGQRGIIDTEVAKGTTSQWWDNSQIHLDPFVRTYSELRDEIRRLEFDYRGGFEVVHSLDDAIYDLAVLDRMRSNAIERPWQEYYGMQNIPLVVN